MRDTGPDTASADSRPRVSADVAAAFVFLTRLPVRWPASAADDQLARAVLWFPVVGVVVGTVGGLAGAAAIGASAPALAAAAIAAGIQILITGALHEDGLADMADGVGGGRTREDKLAIMRDSRIGTYGVLALVIMQAARLGALAALLTAADAAAAVAAIAAAAAASRAAPGVLMAALPAARPDGLAATAATPSLARVAGAAVVAAGLTLVLAGPVPAAVALGVGAAAAALIALAAHRFLGGHTGDVLGAAQQTMEVAMLIALSATGSSLWPV